MRVVLHLAWEVFKGFAVCSLDAVYDALYC